MLKPQDDNTAAALGVIGMITAGVIVLTMGTHDEDVLWFGRGGLIVVAGCSAWLAGRLCGGLFGHSGWLGWLKAAFGAFLSTICGAMIGGTFVMPLVGTLFAPLVVVGWIVFVPTLTICWSVAMIALHLWALEAKSFSESEA